MNVARNDPAIPSAAVRTKPIGLGPGVSQRAIKPAMKPIRMIQMMFHTILSPYDSWYAISVYRAAFQSCAALNVSQLSSFPHFRPFVNQRVRCSEEPWVKASGTT